MAEYFGPRADESIRRFLSCADQAERNRIFDVEIRPVFEKLIHSLIFVYKFQNLDDISTMKAECLTHLYEMLPKFDPDRGTKAFSYFNVVARNWFINKSKDIRRRERNESDLPAGLDHEQFKSSQNQVCKHFEEDVVEKEFWVSLSKEMASWRDLQMRPQEREVLDKVIFLFQNSDLISIYNRKAIHIYLRDLTNLNIKQVSGSLKRLRDLYLAYKKRYDDGDQDD